MSRFVLALDQGTTSSRAVLFDSHGEPRFQVSKAITQSFPRPGWVEHDPNELWSSIQEVGRQVIAEAGITSQDIAAIGLANQRETVVVWNTVTGSPVHPAIVWQDRRTADFCQELRERGLEAEIKRITGLEVDPYFSATKLRWLLRELGSTDNLAFGTVDSWLLYNLTGGRVHATDFTNASRTMLLDLDENQWSTRMLDLFEIDPEILPELRPSSSAFGTTQAFGGDIPISGIAGDQQAALFAQGCSQHGMAKCTYGTGAFILTSSGHERADSHARLLTARTASTQSPWALEGSVFAAGAAVNWLCSPGLGLFADAREAEAAARTASATSTVEVIPAFAGLGAPYWAANAKAGLLGMTASTGKAEIARATFTGVAQQCADVLEAAEKDLGHRITEVRVDGGLSQSDLLLQTQADLLGAPVIRTAVAETTALGAAFLAGLGVGFWSSEYEVQSLWRAAQTFEPRIDADAREAARAEWRSAIEAILAT